ncbi:uncharacterized protein NMK_3027 [Novimethylophilus kurashikiensis]|uniref:DUF218 domain-containing protein n=1 Tax=Novimethylophilus kurashikiensis TaxID=1825523 RepID=A0A2R5FB06_9PROT|nr:YdcF family protein [Novimethylophilus kurashikiensis]GBG15420.1 uncharacterized protein NMK_3027 [Novimethylophilus kurashikiensis]
MKLPPALRLIKIILGLTALSITLAALTLTVIGFTDHIEPADAIIVPGNTVNQDGTLSDRLKGRLDAALEVFQAGRCKLIFVSGAVGAEGVDEAQAMRGYLIDRGVPAIAIIQDSRGFNTVDTAANAAIALHDRGYTRVLAVSQFFHIPRLQWLLKAQGLNVVGHAHARYYELRDLYAVLREVAAMSVVLFKHFM